jgi:hypothetical protein
MQVDISTLILIIFVLSIGFVSALFLMRMLKSQREANHKKAELLEKLQIAWKKQSTNLVDYLANDIYRYYEDFYKKADDIINFNAVEEEERKLNVESFGDFLEVYDIPKIEQGFADGMTKCSQEVVNIYNDFIEIIAERLDASSNAGVMLTETQIQRELVRCKSLLEQTFEQTFILLKELYTLHAKASSVYEEIKSEFDDDGKSFLELLADDAIYIGAALLNPILGLGGLLHKRGKRAETEALTDKYHSMMSKSFGEAFSKFYDKHTEFREHIKGTNSVLVSELKTYLDTTLFSNLQQRLSTAREKQSLEVINGNFESKWAEILKERNISDGFSK